MTDIDIDAIRNDLDMRQQFIDLNRPVPTFLTNKIADQATALLAKVDELTAERDASQRESGELASELSKAWDALNRVGFQSPTDGVAELIDQMSAALAETREHLALDRQAVATLRRREQDALAQLTAANRRADGLAADLRSANTANTAWANQGGEADAYCEYGYPLGGVRPRVDWCGLKRGHSGMHFSGYHDKFGFDNTGTVRRGSAATR